MRFTRWLRTLFPVNPSRRPIHEHRRASLICEALEERRVPTRYFVNAAANGDGSTWANAFHAIPSAINATHFGDEIWVAKGTYLPTTGTDQNASFALKNGVKMYGGFAGNETSLSDRNLATNVTILSGDLGTQNVAGDNSRNVVTATNVSSSTILDGFTITAGNSPDFNAGFGAGLKNTNGSPRLVNLIFTGNTSYDGAGMYSDSGAPTLTNVTFDGNTASHNGGGLYVKAGDPVLNFVTFTNNTSSGDGGGMWFGGGNTLNINGATFDQNNADSRGGGLYAENSTYTIAESTFQGNTAPNSRGGGIYGSNNHATLTNDVLQQNFASEGGGYGSIGDTLSVDGARSTSITEFIPAPVSTCFPASSHSRTRR